MNTPDVTSDGTSERDQRLYAILASYYDAQRAGQLPERAAWLAEHAEFAPELESFLNNQAALAARVPAADPQQTAALTDAPTVGTHIRYVGDYELRKELARGGMGVVYRARQVSLNRSVALKMVLAGLFAGPTEKERFRAEATAAAQLEHPHIVPIYEVGEHDSQPYFSMKLLTGGSLADKLKTSPAPRDWSVLAKLLVPVCQAVHYAHQHGILHRDLKPANVLLDEDGTPYVADFGLAKRLDAGQGPTISGSIVGSPAYMAPEQAAGARSVSVAADVYSLGSILYEMLTGQPPFRGENVLETLRQVREKEPTPPQKITPAAPADLCVIALKCLHKEPGRRYASAAALAEDLERWSKGEPILARPVGSLERAVLWTRRNPAIAALSAVIVLSLLTGTIVSTVFAYQAVHAEGQAKASAQQARDHAEQAQRAQIDAELQRQNAEQQRDAADHARTAEAQLRAQEATLRKAAETAKTQAESAKTQAERDRDAKQVALQQAEGLRLGAAADAARFRTPTLGLLLALEAVERNPAPSNFAVLHAALSDCREIKTLLPEKGDYGAEHFTGTFHAIRALPGERVLIACGASLRVYTADLTKMLVEWTGFGQAIHSVSVNAAGTQAAVAVHNQSNVEHPDGKVYQYTNRMAYIVDLTTGKEVARLRGAANALERVHFSPDGQTAVTACWNGIAHVHDLRTGELRHKLEPYKPVQDPWMAFFLDLESKSLRSAHHTGAYVVTVPASTLVSSYGYGKDWGEKEAKPTDPPFAPNTRTYSGTSFGSGSASFTVTGLWWTKLLKPVPAVAEVWDAATHTRIRRLSKPSRTWGEYGHRWHTTCDVLSPDGTLLALGFGEGDATIWELATGRRVGTLTLPVQPDGKHPGVTALAWRPDGKQLAVAGAEGVVRLFDLKTKRVSNQLHGHTDRVTGVQYHAAGARLLTRSADGTARVWSGDGAELAVLRGHEGSINDLAWSADGTRVWTVANAAHLWQVGTPATTGRQLPERDLTAFAYSPDGTRLVTGNRDETASLWNPHTGERLFTLGKGRKLGAVNVVAFSADGQRVATGAENRSSDGTNSAVIIWDATTGQEVTALADLESGVNRLCFSPDGHRLFTLSDGNYRTRSNSNGVKLELTKTDTRGAGGIQSWDAHTGKLLATLDRPKTDSWYSDKWLLEPNRAGDRLAVLTAGQNSVQLLSATDLKPVVQCRGGERGVGAGGRFSADGQWFLAQSYGGLVAFETTKGQERMRFSNFWSVRDFALVANDTRLVIAADRQVWVYDWPSRKHLRTLPPTQKSLTALAVTADGQRAVTGSEDGLIALWDVGTGQMLGEYRGHTDTIKRLELRADGQQIASLSKAGVVRLDPIEWKPVALARKPRELSEAERTEYGLLAAKEQKRTQPKIVPPPGEPLPEPFTLPPPVSQPAAESAWKVLPETADRTQLLDFAQRFPGSVPALVALRKLETLPGPLAGLTPSRIAATEQPAQPLLGLVAVIGESRQRHLSNVRNVRISPDGQRIAASADDGTTFYDATTLARTAHFAGSFQRFLSPTRFVAQTGEFELSDLQTPQVKRQLPKRQRDHLQAASNDGRFSVWINYDGRNQRNLWIDHARPDAVVPLHTSSETEECERIWISPDDRFLVLPITSHRKERSRHQLQVYRVEADGPQWAGTYELKAETYWLEPLFHPTAANLAVSTGEGKTVLLFALGKTGATLQHTLKLPQSGSLLAYTPDGRGLFIRVGEHTELWDVQAQPPTKVLTTKLGNVWRLAAAPGAFPPAWLAVGNGNALLRLDREGIDYRERTPLIGLRGEVRSLALSPDDRTLVVGDWEGRSFVHRLDQGQFGPGLPMNLTATQAHFAPDGQSWYTGHYSIRRWHLDAGQPKLLGTKFDDRNNAPVQWGFTADGRRVLRASWSEPWRYFDVSGPTAKLVWEKKPPVAEVQVRHLALSPSGQFAAWEDVNNHIDGRGGIQLVRLSDTGMQPVIGTALSGEHPHWLPDGRHLLTHNAHTLRIHDLQDTNVPEVYTFTLKKDGERLHVVPSRSGARLAVYSDRTLAIVDWPTKRELARWELPLRISAVTLAHDGQHVVVGYANGVTQVLRW